VKTENGSNEKPYGENNRRENIAANGWRNNGEKPSAKMKLKSKAIMKAENGGQSAKSANDNTIRRQRKLAMAAHRYRHRRNLEIVIAVRVVRGVNGTHCRRRIDMRPLPRASRARVTTGALCGIFCWPGADAGDVWRIVQRTHARAQRTGALRRVTTTRRAYFSGETSA
jgi:hypothetical protein